jgi:hypothetical protein
MKLASYIAEGREAFGAVVAGGVITLNEQLGNRYPSLRHALASNGCRRYPIRKRFSVPASIIAGMPPRPVVICPSNPACSYGSQTRWSAMRAS